MEIRRHVGHVMYSSLKGGMDITVNAKQTNNTIAWTHEITVILSMSYAHNSLFIIIHNF